MRKILILFVVTLIGFTSCTDSEQSMTVTVTNSLTLERAGETVEVPMSDVTARLKLANTAQTMVLDVDGQQAPHRVTHDEKVVFPITIGENNAVVYTIRLSTPTPFDVIACGKYYSERLDDVAWKSDPSGFHAYGPALQACRERGFGYDLFTKYNTTEPTSEPLYIKGLNPEKRTRIAELKKTDPETASKLQNAISYHIDREYGMDCYVVGPTLGADVAALVAGDTTTYPYCCHTQEIFDNDPLHFMVKLEFSLLVVHGDSSMVGTRVISSDTGSYLNKAVASYTNLEETMPVATGSVLREPDGAVVVDTANGYITYVGPTTDRNDASSKIFAGTAPPAQVKEAEVILLSEKEKKDRDGTDDHVLTISEYEPGSKYTYYWGSAWNKTAVKTPDVWNKYMTEYT